jgi:hypothetical protein
VAARLDEHALSVLDLGSGAVKALVVGGRRTSPEVLGIGVAPVPPPPPDGRRDVGAVLEACERALEQAEDTAGVLPVRAVIGLTDPRGQVVSGAARLVRPHPDQPFSAEEARAAVARAERAALHTARQRDQAEFLEPSALRPLNAAVLRLTLNGATISELGSRAGEQVECAIAASFVSEGVTQEAEEVAEQLDLDMEGIWLLPFLAAHACQGADALVIDVGEAISSASIVRDGWCAGAVSVPIGSAALEQQLGAELGISLEEAHRALLAHAAGAGTRGPGGAAARAVPDLAAHFAGVLGDALTAALTPVAERGIPGTFILIGGGSGVPEVWDTLRSRRWHETPGGTVRLERPGLDAALVPVRCAVRLPVAQLLPALGLAAAAIGRLVAPARMDTLLRQARPRH